MQYITVSENGSELLRRELPDADVTLTIGRHSEADVVLSGGGVSRRHALLHVLNGAVFVEDAGSSGGTYVDGQKITGPVCLEPGSKVGISRFILTVEDSASSAAVPEQNIKQPAPLKAAAPAAAQTSSGMVVNNFLDEFKNVSLLYSDSIMMLAKQIHTDVLDNLKLSDTELKDPNNPETQGKIEACLARILKERRHEIPDSIPLPLFRQALLDEFIGFGPISPLLRSPQVSEIMINGPDVIFVESKGKIYDSGVRFFNHQHLLSILQRIVEPLGRHIDDASPMVDARLPDGSRVNAVIPPLALDGVSMTIRKFADKKLSVDDLIGFGSMTPEMAKFLEAAVKNRQNILVSGGTGSGKTTLLNVLSLFIPQGERVITIEDSAELKLTHRNLVRLEARPANIEGKGKVAIRDLLINTLRMRPDRIIVGECRGAEALDMLQAMNTGHDGSLTTCHANTPRDALARVENMVMMAGFELPVTAIREQIASALNLIIQQTRLADGSRKIVKISEVTSREGDHILLQDIFVFQETGIKDGVVEGYHTATGNIPMFVEELRRSGKCTLDMSVFVPKN